MRIHPGPHACSSRGAHGHACTSELCRVLGSARGAALGAGAAQRRRRPQRLGASFGEFFGESDRIRRRRRSAERLTAQPLDAAAHVTARRLPFRLCRRPKSAEKCREPEGEFVAEPEGAGLARLAAPMAGCAGVGPQRRFRRRRHHECLRLNSESAAYSTVSFVGIRLYAARR